jgi:hypothetical protein
MLILHAALIHMKERVQHDEPGTARTQSLRARQSFA